MDEVAQRLEKALKKRDSVIAEKQRIQGRLESAEQALSDVEAQIKQKKIDPEKIGAAIEKLQKSYETLVGKIEEEVAEAEEALAPYLKESS